MKNLVVLSLAAALVLACSAFTHKKEAAPSRSELITAKTWKMNGYKVTPAYDFLKNGAAITDIYQHFNCYADNTISFEKSGSFQHRDGEQLCGNSQSETGTWFFDPSDSILIRQSAGESFCVDILEISANKLAYSYKIEKTGPDGMPLTLTFTEEYIAQ
jgi:hypothetical protein